MKVLMINAGAEHDEAAQEILLTIQKETPGYESAKIICLGDADIRFCKGCMSCYATGRCPLQDDMEALIEEIDAADMLIVAAPSYWSDMPGQLKVLIDRCTVYGDANPNPCHRTLKDGKKCYTVALRKGERPLECQHIIESVRHWCRHMKMDMADSIYFCGIRDREDIIRYKDCIRSKAEKWIAG